jgi:hypothetical protein
MKSHHWQDAREHSHELRCQASVRRFLGLEDRVIRRHFHLAWRTKRVQSRLYSVLAFPRPMVKWCVICPAPDIAAQLGRES